MNITFDDPRLTAYALDELDQAGRKAIETEIQDFGECRGEIEAITRAAGFVRTGLASEPMPALTSAQRSAIEAKFRRSSFKPKLSWIPSVETGRGGFSWRLKVGLATLVALLLYLAVMQVGPPPIVQKATAETAYVMIKMAGTTVIKDGLVLSLPEVTSHDVVPMHGMKLQLAPECGALGSSLILLVASVLMGNLYLRSAWKRALLTLFVVPLAIVKNGLRIFTVAELCVRLGPEAIHSPLHQHSGPTFFAFSLIPFVLFLVWLRRLESKS